ncbi:hypothetical protein ASPWEDRAFT_176122 [Aspergillus wentii DTO 134E9]|uniref:holo-[acyl-carrier-protein] synthase n=1 Tax=Aspergillus wentii DTO 134E9 TaxID=1073089 RepID=A0A1L9R7Y0_ASPWE|nr:uncharacterized protein ASPWEDRAFT_176122 [Aspergillus wentii DTO 134E9]KAI9927640.1 hypothetical protein MW887_003261 [Aspergillus wentii]OJJ31021.1 hypothetical protein ASPWEDRAFT_176122 [Aspergillus wentii DTO 134E9]
MEQLQDLVRWYVDTRPLTSTTATLPLLDTLQPADQETAKKYYHLSDKHMSLASYLLKYLFIHRTCRIPWKEVSISRTPAPHSRPCFIPSPSILNNGQPIPSIEFNVSHQASLVGLAGTTTPSSPNIPGTQPTTAVFAQPNPSSTPISSVPQVGIDITCVNERRNGKSNGPTTIQAFREFVDIFAEVFSQRELETIKTLPPGCSVDEAVQAGLRLFYTYWALKEAYIKMTGEALLAPWLRELEFTNVVAPSPKFGQSSGWNNPYTGVQAWLYGKIVEDVRIDVVAYEKDYIVATAARGGGIGAGSHPAVDGTDSTDPWQQMQKIDIEKDIAPCATGSCRCLD